MRNGTMDRLRNFVFSFSDGKNHPQIFIMMMPFIIIDPLFLFQENNFILFKKHRYLEKEKRDNKSIFYLSVLTFIIWWGWHLFWWYWLSVNNINKKLTAPSAVNKENNVKIIDLALTLINPSQNNLIPVFFIVKSKIVKNVGVKDLSTVHLVCSLGNNAKIIGRVILRKLISWNGRELVLK